MTPRKDPLEEFVDAVKNPVKEKQKQKKQKENHEDVVFSVIISLFIVGLILATPSAFIGKVVFEPNTEIIYFNQQINESKNIRLTAVEDINSLRVTGAFIGNGTGKIYLGDILVVDSTQLKTNDNILITGYVVKEDLIEIIEESDQNSVNTTPVVSEENVSIEIQEQLVQEEDLGLENITELFEENISIALNETISEDLTEANITLDINETTDENITKENITLEINETIFENTSLEPEINISVEGTISSEIIEFDNYCLDTCGISMGTDKINLRIELENMILNLTSFTYTYGKVIIIEENITEPIYNLSTGNLTSNLSLNTSLNVSSNITPNTSSNITTNLSENVSLEITQNITANVSINQTQNITINLTQENITNIIEPKYSEELATLSFILENKALKLSSYQEDTNYFDVTVSKDRNNYVVARVKELSDTDVDLFTIDDSRINSQVISLGEKILNAEIVLDYETTDVILNCLQFEETRRHDDIIRNCKKWVEYDAQFNVANNSIYFNIDEPGIYTTAELISEEKEYIPTNSVYQVANCPSCDGGSDCISDQFCVFQNLKATEYGINAMLGFDNQSDADTYATFMAQFDFDIWNLRDSFDKAEVCAYSYYDAGETTVNYVKQSNELSCSPVSQEYYVSGIISYDFIDQEKGWKCIEVTHHVSDSIDQGLSNLFLNWMGQELNGKTEPYNCYRAITDLSACGGFNPSGADDCRPYLKLTYKSK